jgi:hypothetical protein
MDQFENKIRISIPEYISEILNIDMYDFNLSKNNLCNKIFFAFHDKADLEIVSKQKHESKILQFTLNKLNSDLFIDYFTNNNLKNKSAYFRSVVLAYCNQPRYLRELSINEKSVNLINQAINNRKQLVIRYKDELRTIEPYAILHSENETRNYIYSYCHKKQQHCNYRLSNIEAVTVSFSNDLINPYDEDLINGVKANFDPFLSYGKLVRAKLSELGKDIYEKNITHRPHILKQENDIYEFECSEIRAQLYFAQFLGEVEILEPKSLREWFKQGAKKLFDIYN